MQGSMAPPNPRHQFWIDRGGTFTDCIHRDRRTGAIGVTKVLSSDQAPLQGIRALLGLGAGEPIPTSEVRMGTTLATNALLERRGCRTVLIADEGLGELSWIGDQTRPELFALEIDKPEPLAEEVIEVGARMVSDGSVLRALDVAALRRALEAARQRGAESVAVSLIHAYRDGSLEGRVAAVAAELGFAHVSLSHEISNELGLLGRTDTTTANAYLTPLLTQYMQKLEEALGRGQLRMMQSNGGLVDASVFIGRNAVVSGPAAGVVATGAVADELGLSEAIGFDMGGTSTDVSRYAGQVSRVFESEIAGIRIRAPMIELHTVAAGGGSICRLEAKRMTVGPQSAGADPGPICYGKPGAEELTLTDVSLCLGRLAGDRFPFALNEEQPREKLEQIASALRAEWHRARRGRGCTRLPAGRDGEHGGCHSKSVRRPGPRRAHTCDGGLRRRRRSVWLSHCATSRNSTPDFSPVRRRPVCVWNGRGQLRMARRARRGAREPRRPLAETMGARLLLSWRDRAARRSRRMPGPRRAGTSGPRSRFATGAPKRRSRSTGPTQGACARRSKHFTSASSDTRDRVTLSKPPRCGSPWN